MNHNSVCVCVCVCRLQYQFQDTQILLIFCELPFSWTPSKTNCRNLHLKTFRMLSFTNCTDWVRHYKSPTKIRQNIIPEMFYRTRPQSVAFILISEDSIYTKKSQTSETGYRISASTCRRQYNFLSRSVCYLYLLLHQSINENSTRYFFSFPLSSLHKYLIKLSLLHSSCMLFVHLVLSCH